MARDAGVLPGAREAVVARGAVRHWRREAAAGLGVAAHRLTGAGAFASESLSFTATGEAGVARRAGVAIVTRGAIRARRLLATARSLAGRHDAGRARLANDRTRRHAASRDAFTGQRASVAELAARAVGARLLAAAPALGAHDHTRALGL